MMKIINTLILLISIAHSDIAVIDTWSISVRSSPSLSLKPIGYAKMGDHFEIIHDANGWLKVEGNKFISKAGTKIIKKDNIIKLEVIYDKAIVRNKPITNTKSFVREIIKGTKIDAIVLLSSGWYVLTDGNLVYYKALKEINSKAINIQLNKVSISANDSIRLISDNMIMLKDKQHKVSQSVNDISKENMILSSFKADIIEQNKILQKEINTLTKNVDLISNKLTLKTDQAEALLKRINKDSFNYAIKIKQLEANISKNTTSIAENKEDIGKLTQSDTKQNDLINKNDQRLKKLENRTYIDINDSIELSPSYKKTTWRETIKNFVDYLFDLFE